MTFRWSPEPGARVPKAVLLRLRTIADKAYFDGRLASYLLDEDGAGWSKTLRLRSDLRCTYRFYLDFGGALRAGHQPTEEEWYGPMNKEGTVADPLNPQDFPPVAGAPRSSLLELPDAPAQPWRHQNAATARGAVTQHELASPLLGNSRPVWIYTPAGYEQIGGGLPVVVLLDGNCWIEVDLPTTLDNLIAAGEIPPTVVVMVASLDKATRTRELTGHGHALFLRFLLEELLPWTGNRCRITDDPQQTVIAGQSFGGLTAAYAGLHAAHRFGLVLSQSGSFWWPDGSEFDVDGRALIREFVTAPRAPVRFYQEAGLVEWLLLDCARAVNDQLISFHDARFGMVSAVRASGASDAPVAVAV